MTEKFDSHNLCLSVKTARVKKKHPVSSTLRATALLISIVATSARRTSKRWPTQSISTTATSRRPATPTSSARTASTLSRKSTRSRRLGSWSFFSHLDYLIGSTTTLAKKAHSSPLAVPLVYQKPPSGLVVQSVVLSQKRLSPTVDDSYFRRNYSTVTMAATAEKQEEEEETE
ncbi:hypothetical protein ACSBR1_031100 [Camellia fascicularis]